MPQVTVLDVCKSPRGFVPRLNNDETVVNVIKLFSSLLTYCQSKLKCLSVKNIFRLVWYLSATHLNGACPNITFNVFIERLVSYFPCKQKMMSFRIKASWTKMTSLRGKLTAQACYMTKVNKAYDILALCSSSGSSNWVHTTRIHSIQKPMPLWRQN